MKYGLSYGHRPKPDGDLLRLGLMMGVLVWGGGVTIVFFDHHWIFTLVWSMVLAYMHWLPLAGWLAAMCFVGTWLILLGRLWRRTSRPGPRERGFG